MSPSILAVYAHTIDELDTVCAELTHQVHASTLTQAEYLTLNLKCLAEREKNEPLAQEAKRFAHFLHISLTHPPHDQNEFIVSLTAHRQLIRQRATQTPPSPSPPISTAEAPSSPPNVHIRQHLALLAPLHFQVAQLGSQLQWFGYGIQHLHEPEALLSMQPRPEAILMFSRFDGADLPRLSRLKSLMLKNFKDTALIFLTPNLSFEIQLAALRVGAKAVLSWPTEREELVEILEHVRPCCDTSHAHILIMTHTRSAAEAFSSPLEHAGFRISIIEDPAELINRAISIHPDLVLIEDTLPQCDGIELAYLLRQHPQLAPLPVMLLCSDARHAARVAEIAPADIDGTLLKPVAISTLIDAVTHRIQRYRQHQEHWATDLLTGLPPRTAFPSALETERTRCELNQTPLIMVVIKLDHLSLFNERYGHTTGDRLIRAAARFFQANLPRNRWLGRFSGSSFVILLPDHSLNLAAHLLEDLHSAYARIRHPFSNKPIYHSCTIAAVQVHPQESTETLLERAHSTLKHAQTRGANVLEIEIEPETPPS